MREISGSERNQEYVRKVSNFDIGIDRDPNVRFSISIESTTENMLEKFSESLPNVRKVSKWAKIVCRDW